jgi:hypothetical protein
MFPLNPLFRPTERSCAVETHAYTPDERLYSPYTEDEPIDEQALHLAYVRRGVAQRGIIEGQSVGEVAPGGLFLDSDAIRRKANGDGDGGWGLPALRSFAGVF